MQCDMKSSLNRILLLLITALFFHPPRPIMHMRVCVCSGGLRIAPLKERFGLITLTPTRDPTEIPTWGTMQLSGWLRDGLAPSLNDTFSCRTNYICHLFTLHSLYILSLFALIRPLNCSLFLICVKGDYCPRLEIPPPDSISFQCCLAKWFSQWVVIDGIPGGVIATPTSTSYVGVFPCP